MQRLKYGIKVLILRFKPLFLMAAHLYLWWQLLKQHNYSPLKAKDEIMRGRIYRYADLIEIRVFQKRYLLPVASNAYTFEVIKHFKQYVDAVEGEIDQQGHEVYDFSQVKLHKVKNDGRKMYYYLMPEIPMTDEAYLHFFKIMPGDVILDAGSFAGLTAARFAERVKTTGKVICLEPDPFNYELLVKNIKHLNLNNVTAYPYALWNEGEMELRFLADRGMGSTLLTYTATRVNQSYVSVPTIDFLGLMAKAQIEKFDLLKIDIEGAEYAVFAKIGEFFERCKPRQIMLEVHPDAHNQINPAYFVDILRRYHYDARMMVAGHDILVGATLDSAKKA